MQPIPCPEPGRLAAYLDGNLGVPEAAALEAHLAGCEACRAVAGEPLPPMPEGWISPAVLAPPRAPGRMPASRWRGLAVAASLMLAAGMLWGIPRLREPGAPPASPGGRQHPGVTHILLGGDVLATLDHDAAVAQEPGRALRLLGGGILCEAAPRALPFEVRTPAGTVQAAGGAVFGLRHSEGAGEAASLLRAAEAAPVGSVACWVRSGSLTWVPALGPPVSLHAGQRGRLGVMGASGIVDDAAGVAAALAWRLRGVSEPSWTRHGQVVGSGGGVLRLLPGPCSAVLTPPRALRYGFEVSIQRLKEGSQAGIAIQVGARSAVWVPPLPVGQWATVRVLVGDEEIVASVEGGESRRIAPDALRSNLLPPAPGVGVVAWDGEVLVRDARLVPVRELPPASPSP